MIAFAVQHDGMPENTALWVLATEGDMFLLCGEQGFYWYPIDKCTLARLWTPDNALGVMDVSGVQQRAGGIVLPGQTQAYDGGRGF